MYLKSIFPAHITGIHFLQHIYNLLLLSASVLLTCNSSMYVLSLFVVPLTAIQLISGFCDEFVKCFQFLTCV